MYKDRKCREESDGNLKLKITVTKQNLLKKVAVVMALISSTSVQMRPRNSS